MSTDNAIIIRDVWLNRTNDFQQRIPDPTQGNIQEIIDELVGNGLIYDVDDTDL